MGMEPAQHRAPHDVRGDKDFIAILRVVCSGRMEPERREPDTVRDRPYAHAKRDAPEN